MKTGRKKLKGTVVGNKMDKTIKVSVENTYRHPVYKKVLRRDKVYMVHTEKDIEVGEEVTIVECKPYSKNVTFRVE